MNSFELFQKGSKKIGPMAAQISWISVINCNYFFLNVATDLHTIRLTLLSALYLESLSGNPLSSLVR